MELRRARQLYLDCNSTTPVLPEAAAAAIKVMKSLYGNPSSPHQVGLQARRILESTRELAAQAIGALPEQIVFTSGATEAIQTVIFSVLCHLKKQKGSKKRFKFLYSTTEHKAVSQALSYWMDTFDLPVEVVSLSVDSQGQIIEASLRAHLKDASLLCTMAVNNETGVIQNLQAIEKVLREDESEVLWFSDCVQALGKMELQLNSTRIDYAVFSGHKLYAPKGIGFLYYKQTAPLHPLIVGGGQEGGLRSGTENLPGIAALQVVLKALLASSDDHSLFRSDLQLKQFRERLLAELKKVFPKLVLNMPLTCSVPTTLNFSVPGFTSKELIDLFDAAGLRLGSGSACNSASVEPSHVLLAMGFSEERSSSAIRLSFGPCTVEAEIELACQLIQDCAKALAGHCRIVSPSGKSSQTDSHLQEGLIHLRDGAANAWILVHRDSRRCFIIDPTEALADQIENFVRCQKLEILAILDTHSHADHDSIRPSLQQKLESSFLSKSGFSDALGWPQSSFSSLVTVSLANGEKVPAIQDGDRVLACMPCPGHTQDSHAYLYGKVEKGVLTQEQVQFAFCGDTILSGGLGRTNFKTSNPQSLFESLKKLQAVISARSLICPAHDYSNSFATSLTTEREESPLLALALGPASPLTLEHFLEKKRRIDTELEALESEFEEVVCGVTRTGKLKNCASFWVTFETVVADLKKSSHSWKIIDIREGQEQFLLKPPGLPEEIRSIPLSQLVNYMKEMIPSELQSQTLKKKANQPPSKVVLICRTGTRSHLAAQALRRIGIENVYSLKGGLALVGMESLE